MAIPVVVGIHYLKSIASSGLQLCQRQERFSRKSDLDIVCCLFLIVVISEFPSGLKSLCVRIEHHFTGDKTLSRKVVPDLTWLLELVQSQAEGRILAAFHLCIDLRPRYV